MHFKCKFIIISHLVLLVLDIKILMYESSCLVINKRNKLHCRFFEVYLMIYPELISECLSKYCVVINVTHFKCIK